MDIQILIWIGALPWCLTNMTTTCEFGYPNSNLDKAITEIAEIFIFGHPNVKMDRCEEKPCTLTFIFGCPNSKMDSNPRVNA